jgi:hypothetical protein
MVDFDGYNLTQTHGPRFDPLSVVDSMPRSKLKFVKFSETGFTVYKSTQLIEQIWKFRLESSSKEEEKKIN